MSALPATQPAAPDQAESAHILCPLGVGQGRHLALCGAVVEPGTTGGDHECEACEQVSYRELNECPRGGPCTCLNRAGT